MKKGKVTLFISNWPSQQLILCRGTQKAINVKSNIKDKQALLSAKLSKKTWTNELLKNPKNKQRKPKSQFHNAINRKSFYAFKKKKKKGMKREEPFLLSLRRYTKNILHWYSGETPFQKGTSSWHCSTHVSSHMSWDFRTPSVVYNWKNFAWEITTCSK